ncbi:MAG: RNB domain-containing ribonuclease [Neisseria sp.]|nr:RNB domain-containing ribonuclease [Neisseria sp.]
MNIFYEESGQFKVAKIVQKSDNSYQADNLQGKRCKVKANHVFVEFDGDMAAFLQQAEQEASEIDTDLLWEVCGEDEFSAQDIAAEYFGKVPSARELASILMALYAAPAYFYKKSKGIFKAAPEETLKQALAAIERKKQQDAQLEEWVNALKNQTLPSAVAADLKAILHAPDKQSLTYKAFTKAASELKLSPYELAKKLGAVTSFAQFMQDGFELKNYPKGVALADVSLPDLAELPLADVAAFSIDDADTSEVDDALSLQDLGNGKKRVGIHIAAPSLVKNAEIDDIIAQRQSTAYFPAGKITMLPDNWIAAFSLDEGKTPAAVSVYFEVDSDFQVSDAVCKIERISISKNLRIQAIESHFNRESDLSLAQDAKFEHHHKLLWLHQFAIALQKQRDRYEENRPRQYDYSIELSADGIVSIATRERGSPIDTLVSEMMILANSTWAKMLHEHDLGGIFRVQTTGKVRMSSHSEEHIGMGLQHYGWFTSPLRRAVDFINQQQLLSIIDAHYSPRFTHKKDQNLFASIRDFEATYAGYQDFQRDMESYWSMVYVQQQNLREVHATLLKDDLVRLQGLPLVTRATGIPFDLPPKTTVKLAITACDPEKQHLALNYLNAVI